MGPRVMLVYGLRGKPYIERFVKIRYMFCVIKIYCMLTPLQMVSDAVISFMDIEDC